MTAVLCKCGRAHGILEFKVLRLKVHHEKKPTRKEMVSPLRVLPDGTMVASCCAEPLCDMLGAPVRSRNVDQIRYAHEFAEGEA